MPEGKCPKCGYHCYGWALTEPEQQTCPKCGTRLEIDLGKGERPIRRTPQDPKPY